MKRLSRNEQLRLASRARKHGAHNIKRRTWHVKKKIVREVILPPISFNLSTNYEETVRCLRRLKKAALTKPIKNVERRVSIDLANIQEISTAAALVLAAEIDRWRQVKKSKLRPRNISKWDPEVKRMLVEIGFFELLDVAPPTLNEVYGPSSDVTVLQMLSGNTLDRKRLAKMEEQLRQVADAFEQDPSIYMALTEAAYNSIKHGYPEGHEFKYTTLRKQWWATGSWSPTNSEVKFTVYDQGVGIAATLPSWDHWEKVTNWVAGSSKILSHLVKEHANMIEAALEVSRTSLTSGHGQGLKDVLAPIDLIDGGKVRILSGKGQILYKSGEKVAKFEKSQHLGGTLIEWTIPVL